MEAISNHESEIQSIQAQLCDIHSLLPSNLQFNLFNLRHAMEENRHPIFILLHIVLQSLIMMSACPSLIRHFSSQMRHRVDVAAAQSIAEILVLVETLDTRVISADPFLDYPLALASRMFLMESGNEFDMRGDNENISIPSELAEANLSTCIAMLAKHAELWGNVRTAETMVEHKSLWPPPLQQSPSEICSSLGLNGVELNSHHSIPHLYTNTSDDGNDLALTFSDSDLSRETSPHLFKFPLLSSSSSQVTEEVDVTSSDPTPTSLLPPVSFASGDMGNFDQLSSYIQTPYSEESSLVDQDYFSLLSVDECLPPIIHEDNNNDRTDSPTNPFPLSPWLLS
ncbi:hypothetical protein BD410DRAFT_212259 [Rickenella mellea]|uniref:Uncharacterized protein n=1 Tax=Rickenella mellea TaxID=50990 RepID=A0A4Y7Q624_9AGAM|nr:hypothetical protein BD410DRAFT_212259 [Rickenella mellea]